VNLSIVLRTKNEGKFLGKTLGLLRQQSYTPRPEIIVVDSGSTDDTLAIASCEDGLRVVNIPADDFTYGRSLNAGIQESRGDVIVALSAHAFPRGERWLNRLVGPFSDPKVAGVYGRQLPHDDAWPSVKRDYLEFYGQERKVQTDPDDPNDHRFSNAASAIRRSLWEKHPFDENLPYCEDWEWARSMLMLGHTIIYEPDAAVYHSHNEALSVVYRRCRREMLARGLLYRPFARSSRWYRIWARSVAADISFIKKNDQHEKWLFWVLVYRLFWAMGRSSHFSSRYS
jgi:glycosyltransferase involved in cell wall biosynthesis